MAWNETRTACMLIRALAFAESALKGDELPLTEVRGLARFTGWKPVSVIESKKR